MRDVKISVKQFDNLISGAIPAPNPRDAFYLKVFWQNIRRPEMHTKEKCMARTKKKKLLTRDMRIQIAKDNYMKWLKSIGVRLDSKGRVINNFKGYPFPDYSSDRNSIPTSDRIPALVLKEQ